MNVTTVKIPKDLEGKLSVTDLVMSRIKLEGDIEITGFHFEVDN